MFSDFFEEKPLYVEKEIKHWFSSEILYSKRKISLNIYMGHQISIELMHHLRPTAVSKLVNCFRYLYSSLLQDHQLIKIQP